MKTKVLNLDSTRRRRDRTQRCDLRPRAARRSHPARRRLAARQAPRRHAQGSDARRNQPHEEEGLQAEGHRPGPSRRAFGAAVRRRREGHGPGPAQPRIRSAEEGARARSAARAFVESESRRARRDRRGEVRSDQDQSDLAERFGKLGFESALIVDGEFDKNFQSQRAQSRACRVAAGGRPQCLRHPAPRQTRAHDALRSKRSRSASHDNHQLRRDPFAGHHRKSDEAHRGQPGGLPRDARRDEACHRQGGRRPVQGEGEGREHGPRQGQAQGLSRQAVQNAAISKKRS